MNEKILRYLPMAAVPLFLFVGTWIALQLTFLKADSVALREEVAALHIQVVELKKVTEDAAFRASARGPEARANAPKRSTEAREERRARRAAAAATPDAATPAEGAPSAPQPRAKAKSKAKAAKGEARPRKGKKRKKRKADAP